MTGEKVIFATMLYSVSACQGHSHFERMRPDGRIEPVNGEKARYIAETLGGGFIAGGWLSTDRI